MARSQNNDSFRVPNSIIQGLTTNTTAELNKLGAFATLVLLGLLTQVSPKSPQKEVRMRLSTILEIVEVSRKVAHEVERAWTPASGEIRKRRYPCRRFSPRHLQMVHEALLALYNQSVLIRRRDTQSQRQRDERQVHLLDMFGYWYQRDGKSLDVDDLPPGSQKVNVGTDERPLWRIGQQTEDADRFDSPSGIVFRLNSELADELAGKKGTLQFTLLARKAFNLFKKYSKNPSMIRLILLVLRQTNKDFSRDLTMALEGLGFDGSHPSRAAESLTRALGELRQLRLVVDFTVDSANNNLTVSRNMEWHREDAASE